MAKQSVLPPAADAQKREVTVNLRFSADDYERLKTVAEFSHTGVASLLFYVTVNTTLPMMEREMKKAQQTMTQTDKPSQSPELPKTPVPLPSPNTEKPE